MVIFGNNQEKTNFLVSLSWYMLLFGDMQYISVIQKPQQFFLSFFLLVAYFCFWTELITFREMLIQNKGLSGHFTQCIVKINACL